VEIAKKSDWTTKPMPEKNAMFILRRHFTEKELGALIKGHIPQEMEDKWFWYYEDGKFYAHRSWTGICIYIIQFDLGTDAHVVTVNRDPEQYKCTDIRLDLQRLSHLLDWWTQEKYDYYHEWLSETLLNLSNSCKAVKQPVVQNSMELDRGDITRLDCDCIVNAANKSLLGGGGVDGAIHRAAGSGLLAECKTLNGCEVGEAKLTGGYNLKAKYVIHTVGPFHKGFFTDKKLLANCYRNSLELAKQHDIHSIAFPAISTGAYGYPIKKAAQIAVETIRAWFGENENYGMQVILSCFNDAVFEAYRELLGE